MQQYVVSLNSIEAYLAEIRFIDKFAFTEKQKNIINYPSISFINEPIAKNEILKPSLKKTLTGLQDFVQDNTITFNSLYTEYIKVVTQFPSNFHPYNFPNFVNGLSIFETVFRGFNHNLLKISLQMVSEELISIHFINEPESVPFSLYQSLITNQSNDNQSQTLLINNLLFLFFIFSLCGEFTYDKPNKINYLNNLNLYNKFYISHANYGLLVHLGVMIYCNLFPYQSSLIKKDTFEGKNTVHWSKSNIINTLKMKSKSTITLTESSHNNLNNKRIYNTNNSYEELLINFYMLDNISTDSIWNDLIKVLICINSFKCFLYESLPNLFDFKINITIINPIEISKTHFGKNFESTYYSKAIYSAQLNIITKNCFSKLFKQWKIDQVVVHLELSKQTDSITNLFTIYQPLIIKAKDFHLKDNTNGSETYITIEALFNEWTILENILNKMSNIKEGNKKSDSAYSFVFNCWKLTINKSLLSKDLNLYFNYSNIQEKTLFNFFQSNTNLCTLIGNYIKFISLIEHFKGYAINIRLFQNSFRSKQLEFYLQIVINTIINHVNDKKLDEYIYIHETNLNYYIPSMHCYINDSFQTKKKHKLNTLKQAFNKINSIKYFRFLSTFFTELSENFDLIVFSEDLSKFQIIRTYDDSKIFFVLSKKEEQPKNLTTAYLLTNTLQNSAPANSSEYILNAYVYLNNEKESYMNVLPLLHVIKSDKGKKCDIEITLFCDKNYLESTVLIEHKFKKLFRYLSEDVDNIYIISKSMGNNIDNNNNGATEFFNYDIYITSRNIRLLTYGKNDFTNDPKYQKFLFSFISILSSCIEMLLYLLKNKDLYISRFIFIYRTINETTYVLDFKNGNMFLKKSTESENLIRMNIKNAIPQFCILSKKETTTYTMSNENFYDVFPRLFLNLNKVSDIKDNFNDAFFRKIHKNIFYEYYDKFYPITFSYEVFALFNSFFLSNDYLSISNGDKFGIGYIFPSDKLTSFDNTFSNMIMNEVIVFTSNMKMLGKEGETYYKLFAFSKLENLIESLKEFILTKDKDKAKGSCYLQKKIQNKDNVLRILEYLRFKGVKEYFIDKAIIEEKIDDYLKEKVTRENDRVENRIIQLTEAAKNENLVGKDQNCYLF